MNLVKSSKYGLSPKEIERRLLSGERFKTIFNMDRIENLMTSKSILLIKES